MKDLGAYFDRYMFFVVHITELTEEVVGTLKYIERISDNFDKPMNIFTVQSVVLSLRSYSISTRSSTNKILLRNIQKLQNIGAKQLLVNLGYMIMLFR